MKVLYINNTKYLAGSSKSLILVVEELSKKNKNFNPVFFLSEGEVSDYLKKKGFKVYTTNWISIFDNTKYSYYRGLRWIVLLREIFYLPFSLVKLCSILKKEKIDIVHLNEATLFFYAYLIKKIFNTPIIIHIRSVQNPEKNIRNLIFNFILNNYVDKVICVDKRVKESLPGINPELIRVVYNGFFKPQFLEENCKGDKKEFIVGFSGMLYKAKGIYELLDAINYLVNQKSYSNIKLYIAGKNPKEIKNPLIKKILQILGLYEDTIKNIENFIKKNRLKDNVKYLGFLNNKELDEFYRKIDLLCFPSKLDAVGRSVFEAGFYEKPSIVALKNSCNDIITHNVSGVIIDTPDANKISCEIERLFLDKKLLKKIGKEIKNIAFEKFDIEKNSFEIYKIYLNLIDKK
jgi:glycosyltransferase involved in cell wall biosynthesis